MFDLLRGVPAGERKYTKYDTMNWLGYNKVRRAIEKKRSEDMNKNNKR